MKTVFTFNFKEIILMAYNTKQKEAVLTCLKEHSEGHVHAADIAEHLARSGSKVGLTTIYRRLDKLVEEGTPAQNFDTPQHPRLKDFLSKVL